MIRIAVTVCFALATFLAACGGPSQEPETSPARPNIVLMLADDLGHGDLGVTGAPDIRTPNLDRLAAEGVRFTHAYANAPVCSPTRAALLTGRYQQRSGVDRVIYADERDQGMPLEEVLLPEVLQQHGYATGIIGKWHLGYPKQYFPTRQGFDEFVGFVAGNIDYFSHTDRLENHDLWRNEEEMFDDRYFTGLIGDEAIGFIDRHAAEPFFLYLPFNAPHDPFQGPEHRDTAGDQHVTRQVNRTREVYKSMVEAMDQHIGRVLAHLEEKGLAENTIVFFMSDNGGLPVVARNDPFSGYKTELREGGIRTPLLARWTGRFAAGKVVDDVMAIGMDLFPTILELAGAAAPEGHNLDGVSLAPVLTGGASLPPRTLYFHYEHPAAAQTQRAMVGGGWKYLRDKDGKEYLFHLAEDIAEENNLSSREGERFEQMKQQYEAWEREVFEGVNGLPPRPGD